MAAERPPQPDLLRRIANKINDLWDCDQLAILLRIDTGFVTKTMQETRNPNAVAYAVLKEWLRVGNATNRVLYQALCDDKFKHLVTEFGGELLPSGPEEPTKAEGGAMPQAAQQGRILKDADDELFQIAIEVAFNAFDLKRFANLLLQKPESDMNGAAFLATLNAADSVPSKVHAVLIKWIQTAPPSKHERYGWQLRDFLERMGKNNVIKDHLVYLDAN